MKISGTTASSFNDWTMAASTAMPANGGTSQTSLTNNTNAGLDSVAIAAVCPPSNCTPVYSPDGTKIVFASKTALTGAANGTASASNNIWIMNSDGSGLTALTKNGTVSGGDSVSPVWSLDQSKIYFASKQGLTTTTSSWNATANNCYNIWYMTPSASSMVALTSQTTTGYDSTEPAASSDDVTVAFTSKAPTTAPVSSSNIWTVHNDGTQLTYLTDNTSASLDSKNPVFSPDGSEIAFASKTAVAGGWNGTTSNSFNIWKMKVDGSNQVALTTSTAANLDSVYPSWEPDNLYIVFQSLMKIGATTPTSNNIWVMKEDGTSPTALTQNTNAGLDSYIGTSPNVWYQP
jgi:Tol biopolymer transport system component